MLHAAAMFLGLCVVWLLATQRFETIDDVGVAVIVALVCTAIGMRAAGVSEEQIQTILVKNPARLFGCALS